MSLLTINNDLLWWYSVCYAEDGLDDSSVYWTFWICLPAQGHRNTLAAGGDRPFTFPSSDAGCCVSCGSPDSSVCSEHSAPEASNPVCFSARTSHQVLNWNFYHAAVAENRHGPAQTVWPGVGWKLCTNSQPTCLYYIVLTKSLCLAHTPLFLYSDGETLLVYVFDICTNAPLWKRKWNLDISVIIWLPVFSFTV